MLKPLCYYILKCTCAAEVILCFGLIAISRLLVGHCMRLTGCCTDVIKSCPTASFLSTPILNLSGTMLGALHVGDEIVEICGISVQGRTVDFLQKMLVSTILFYWDCVYEIWDICVQYMIWEADVLPAFVCGESIVDQSTVHCSTG